MTAQPRPFALFGITLSLLLAVSFAMAQAPTFSPPRGPLDIGEPPAVPGGEDIAVQPRGPVHEAFALPPNLPPRRGPLVTRKPPPLIPEVPPEQRPEGDNVQWIPGYWAWDADRNDFLWISGLWRVPPTGQKWIPGAWNSVEGGYQWSPGYWAPADQNEMPYLPPPPASLDNGPNGPPPDEGSFYVPGCWIYQSSRYVWRPGSWLGSRPGMIWMPAYYLWTPAGYRFVPGYWDWPLASRGLLFAPVVFNRPFWTTPGWSYQPRYCIASKGLLSSLFIGPASSGYYFGNYYSPSYRRQGFQPWYANSNTNPLFAWYRWRNRNNSAWLDGMHAAYRAPSTEMRRPPAPRMVQPLSQYNGLRLTRLNASQVAEYRHAAQRLQHPVGPRHLIPETKRVMPLPHAVPTPARPIAPRIQPAPRTVTIPHGSPVLPRPGNIVRPHHIPVPAASHAAPRPAGRATPAKHGSNSGHNARHNGHHR